MSTKVDVRGISVQPDLLLWINDEGAVVGYELGASGTMHDEAVGCLRKAMKQAGQPQRLRVNSPRLAEALGKLQPKIEVICAPTPEFDAIIELFEQTLRNEPPGSLQNEVPEEAGVETQAAVLQAAAKLQKLKPWTVVPGLENVITVTADQCGTHGGVVSLGSQDGRSLTVVLYASRADFDAMGEHSDDDDRDPDDMDAEEAAAWIEKAGREWPPFLSLNFDPGTQAPTYSPILAARRGGWEPLAKDSEISFWAHDKGRPMRGPTLKEAIQMEAVLRALPELLKEAPLLKAAWEGGAPLSRTICAATHVGEITVVMSVP